MNGFLGERVLRSFGMTYDASINVTCIVGRDGALWFGTVVDDGELRYVRWSRPLPRVG